MQAPQPYLWQPASDQPVSDNADFSCTFAGLQAYTHPIQALGIRREHYEQGEDTGPHRHEDFYALYIVQSGRGIHFINGHPYSITRGDVYLMPPGTVHGYLDFSLLTIDAFYFQPQLFRYEELLALRTLAGFWRLLITFEPQSSINSQITLPEAKHDHRFHLSPEQYRLVEAMVSELWHEFMATGPEASVLSQSLFFRLLVSLARWQAPQTLEAEEQKYVQGEPATSIEHIQKHDITYILQLCEERFHEPLTVAQLAAYLFLSPSRFSELFQREVGTSPATYIRRLRLERAQTLLRTTKLTSTQIAHQVGFRDSAQLSRTFRAAFRLTPTAYRAAFRI